jgi:integrase
MASIFLNTKKSRFYTACFTVDGKQFQRSTRVTIKADALLIAALYEKAGREEEAGTLTEERIRENIKFILRAAGSESIEIPTTRSWFTSWAKNAEAARSKGTADRYQSVTKEFLRILGKKADKSITTLSVADIEKFRDYLIAEGEAPASVNLVLKAIRSCLNRALAQGHIEHNRALAIDFVPRDQNGQGKRSFTAEELSKIVITAPTGEWRDLISCGYYIGDRIGSLSQLRFEQFDLKEWTLTYTPGKQRRGGPVKTITIPLHPSLVDLISAHHKSSGPLFPTLSTKRVGGKTGLSLTFRAIIDAAGIQYATKASRGGRGRAIHEVGFHALRRTFNTDLANQGVSQEIRQQLIGHASKEVNDRYTTIELRTLRTAIAKLPALSVTSTDPSEVAKVRNKK